MASNWRQGTNSNSGRSHWQKQNQNKRKHGYNLEPGLTGFLCTCNGKFREKECVRDSKNLLSEFADKIFGPENWGKQTEPEETEKLSEDVDASLEEELAALKAESKAPSGQRRFQVVDSGVNGIVFIKTTIPDPCKLAHSIVASIAETKVQKSKFLLRLIPVEVTCKANLDEICKAAEELLVKNFKEGGKTFSIVYSHKNNNSQSLSRDKVIEALAAQVGALNETNKVDLKTPQLSILVEIIRSVCCLAVVPDYFLLKKYNILEICTPQNPPPSEGDQPREEEVPADQSANPTNEEKVDDSPGKEKQSTEPPGGEGLTTDSKAVPLQEAKD